MFLGRLRGLPAPARPCVLDPYPLSPRLEYSRRFVAFRPPSRFNFYIVLIVYITYTILLNYSLNNHLSNSFIFERPEKHVFKPFLRRYIFLNSHTILSAAYGHSHASCLPIHPAVAAVLARDLCRSCAARLCLRRFAPGPGR